MNYIERQVKAIKKGLKYLLDDRNFVTIEIFSSDLEILGLSVKGSLLHYFQLIFNIKNPLDSYIEAFDVRRDNFEKITLTKEEEIEYFLPFINKHITALVSRHVKDQILKIRESQLNQEIENQVNNILYSESNIIRGC